ncbi:MAG: HD-GYP domain-containing protein, partial [Treponema sp.]|nr:HD-GYP domain-containing protein [Treponema sp.]
SKLIRYPLQLFSILPIIATVVQVFAYGLSLTNISIVFTVTLIYIFVLLDLNKTVEKARQQELEFLKHEKQNLHTMFEQTTEALAKAIDAKDEYTNGHSRRVAEYSKQIAQAAGKSEEECDKTYFAALLHDVGKIGVPIQILSKNGKLTEQEFEQIKSHPVVGGDILSSIKESPWLSLGARYHHEKYNGKGYPDGLKGREIPEIARIIAVADAYDAMTSNRSYRKAIPQHIVREEFVKGIGSQFDPDFAKMMIHMIDLDTEYKMKESITGANLTARTTFHCDSVYNECSKGFGITPLNATISFCSKPDEGVPAAGGLPTLIIFDALDGNVHPGEENNRNLMYLEYAQIRLDGKIVEKNVRKSEIRIKNREEVEKQDSDSVSSEIKYKIEAVRNQDHVYLRISGGNQFFEVLLALPDISRYAFLSISGEHCSVHDISVQVDNKVTPYDSIPRIAEEISYIKDQPQGDIPNIQSNGYRLSSTNSIPVTDQMEITFHAMSYPTARLIWHCPFICLFSSSNGNLNDPDFCEYQLLRLDGESDPSDERVKNEVLVEQTANFKGWENWKEENRKGLDCKISIKKENNKIIIQTENLGLKIKSESVILNETKNLYVALTGDQCAITNIHIEVMKNEQTV